jgi:predicted ArsR family transcriptional regulator
MVPTRPVGSIMEMGSRTPFNDVSARVLEEPRRARILGELRNAPDGLDVAELTARLEIHPNTVRWHLGHLSGAGLVVSRPVHRGVPGRPRIVYEAAAGAAEHADGYRFLAEMLAGALARTADPSGDAERAGRAWGGFLVDRPPPSVRLTADEATARIVQLLAAHGFAPERRDSVVEMHRCPFRELVETHGDVVCGLHRGLLAGALEALEAGVSLEALEPYPVPGVCRARVSVS